MINITTGNPQVPGKFSWLPPIRYLPDLFLYKEFLPVLQKELAWIKHSDAPRHEYYSNDFGQPYTYGRGRGQRTYQAQPWHEIMDFIRNAAGEMTGERYDVCFLNRYLNQSDHLGWHSDNSPEMDQTRSIVTISLGVPRHIDFRRIGANRPGGAVCELDRVDDFGLMATRSSEYRLLLQHGSCLIMLPGMQAEWEHRIPKSSNQCGERISFSLRGFNGQSKGI